MRILNFHFLDTRCTYAEPYLGLRGSERLLYFSTNCIVMQIFDTTFYKAILIF